MSINNLQDVINARAKRRAIDEVQKLIIDLRSNGTLFRLLDNVWVSLNPAEEFISMQTAFLSLSNNITADLITKLTLLYIPEESKKFVKEVEELKQTVNNLRHEG